MANPENKEIILNPNVNLKNQYPQEKLNEYIQLSSMERKRKNEFNKQYHQSNLLSQTEVLPKNLDENENLLSMEELKSFPNTAFDYVRQPKIRDEFNEHNHQKNTDNNLLNEKLLDNLVRKWNKQW